MPTRSAAPGVEGPNLALAAVERFRAEAAPELPPLRVTIDKRIPVAAGLGGGSADAAAVLRAANELAGRPLDADALRALGAALGADVPSQVEPRHALVTGAGEGVEPVELPPMTLLLVPDEAGLSTADVYAQADALGTTRAELDPERVRELAAAAAGRAGGRARERPRGRRGLAAARAQRANGRAAPGGRARRARDRIRAYRLRRVPRRRGTGGSRARSGRRSREQEAAHR